MGCWRGFLQHGLGDHLTGTEAFSTTLPVFTALSLERTKAEPLPV